MVDNLLVIRQKTHLESMEFTWRDPLQTALVLAWLGGETPATPLTDHIHSTIQHNSHLCGSRYLGHLLDNGLGTDKAVLIREGTKNMYCKTHTQ